MVFPRKSVQSSFSALTAARNAGDICSCWRRSSSSNDVTVPTPRVSYSIPHLYSSHVTSPNMLAGNSWQRLACSPRGLALPLPSERIVKLARVRIDASWTRYRLVNSRFKLQVYWTETHQMLRFSNPFRMPVRWMKVGYANLIHDPLFLPISAIESRVS